MDHNSLVTIPPDKPGFCRYGKCEGVSLQVSYRNHHHDHYFWKNHTGSLFSSGNLQNNASSEYNISHYLFGCHGWRNYFYDYENDNIAHEKYKKRIFILSIRIYIREYPTYSLIVDKILNWLKDKTKLEFSENIKSDS